MRTATINVYQFNEIDERAKEHARNWFRSCMDCSDWDGDNWKQSMLDFAEHFGVNVTSWELGDSRGAHVHVSFHRVDNDIREMSFVRLWKWLDANCGTGHQSGHEFIREAANGSCPFTGTYTDCGLFDPLREFVNRPDHRTFEELIRDCFESHVADCRSAAEWSQSDEYIDESIEANEYEFTASGARWND